MSHVRTEVRAARLALALIVALCALALPGAARPAEAIGATNLRVVTANLAFRGNDGVRQDWNTIGPKADIVFVQEAKNVNLRQILDDGTWIVRQHRDDDSQSAAWNEARRGSAVVVRRSAVSAVSGLTLVKGVDASWCPEPGGIMTRWIAKADITLPSGRVLTAASLHMPPPRCAWGPDSPYATMADNVVRFAQNNANGPLILGADWNKVVDEDPNQIGARADLKPRGPDTGLRIDGFYVSQSISTANLHYLAATGSDHRPVKMEIWVP